MDVFTKDLSKKAKASLFRMLFLQMIMKNVLSLFTSPVLYNETINDPIILIPEISQHQQDILIAT